MKYFTRLLLRNLISRARNLISCITIVLSIAYDINSEQFRDVSRKILVGIFCNFRWKCKGKENKKFLLTPWRHTGSGLGGSLRYYFSETKRIRRTRSSWLVCELLTSSGRPCPICCMQRLSFAFHSKYHCNKRLSRAHDTRCYVNFYAILICIYMLSE